MKTSARWLVLALVLATLVLAASGAHADEASARAALANAKIAFTPDAFLRDVAAGNVEHVKLFLEGGIDPAVRNPQSQTALWLAVELKQLAVLQALLAAGVAPNEANAPVLAGGKTIVFGAVDTGDAAFVRALVGGSRRQDGERLRDAPARRSGAHRQPRDVRNPDQRGRRS